jgi:hypothetical protein
VDLTEKQESTGIIKGYITPIIGVFEDKDKRFKEIKDATAELFNF